MDYQLCLAQNTLEALKNNNFVDAETRILIVDFNFYEPYYEMHTMCRLMFEFKLGSIYAS